MSKNNFSIWESTRIQIYKINFPANTYISTKYFANIKELEFLPKYFADMLRDLTDAIKSSYPGVKKKSFNL